MDFQFYHSFTIVSFYINEAYEYLFQPLPLSHIPHAVHSPGQAVVEQWKLSLKNGFTSCEANYSEGPKVLQYSTSDLGGVAACGFILK